MILKIFQGGDRKKLCFISYTKIYLPCPTPPPPEPTLSLSKGYRYLVNMMLYSYLMCSQATDQNIFPEVFRSAQCSIARSQRMERHSCLKATHSAP